MKDENMRKMKDEWRITNERSFLRKLITVITKSILIITQKSDSWWKKVVNIMKYIWDFVLRKLFSQLLSLLHDFSLQLLLYQFSKKFFHSARSWFIQSSLIGSYNNKWTKWTSESEVLYWSTSSWWMRMNELIYINEVYCPYLIVNTKNESVL